MCRNNETAPLKRRSISTRLHIATVRRGSVVKTHAPY
jgi:hypothetical protein